jgi:hypothetical protein
MRRLTPVGLVGALAAGVLAAGAFAEPPEGRAARGLASVKVAQCSRAEHAGAFVGRMRRVPGTERMWMKFKLLELTGSGKYRSVRAPGLGRWRRSRLGVGGFRFRQRVRGLAAGTAYRARVGFRWYGDGHRLLRRTTRRSRKCRQYAALPNLRVVVLRSRPGSAADTLRYVVRVANVGRAAAVDVPVALLIGGAEVDRQTVRRLSAHRSRRLDFIGPRCATGDSVQAVADPDGTVVEASERDNAMQRACLDLRR